MKYPFLVSFLNNFEVTKISYIQPMLVIWRILFWIDQGKQSHDLGIGLPEFAHVYALSTFTNSHFLLKVKTIKPLVILKSRHNDGAWKEKYFFVRRYSIPGGDLLPKAWVKKGKIYLLSLRILRFNFLFCSF